MASPLEILDSVHGNTMFRAPVWNAGQNVDILFLGIPSSLGALSRRKSPELGVSALRNVSAIFPYSLDENNRPLGWFDYVTQEVLHSRVTFADAGNLNLGVHEPLKNLERIPELIRELGKHCRLLLLLGGDHSLTYWTAQGLECPNIVFMDAHEDAAPVKGPYPHHANMVSYIERLPDIRLILQLGTRGLVPNRRLEPETFRFLVKDDSHLDELLPLLGDASTLLSIDWDVVDPAWLSGVSSPMPGGWSMERVLLMGEKFRKAGANIRVVESVEFCPSPGEVPVDAVAILFTLLRLSHTLLKE